MTGRDDNMPPDNDGKEQRQTQDWYRLAGVGFEFVVAFVLFGGVGLWLDRTWNTTPWLTLVGSGLGFATGLWMLVRAAYRYFR